ncbi:NAD(P)-dependent alcohol dehydrogenase [Jiulongibacter sp. NS-SX5]|uniref:NAD(P)-dependent alcohol dehydrogenase n=1 Tax=Jiulongibacter sp. NS-SX5 TaxID=3463854 RepID=UPI0040590B44
MKAILQFNYGSPDNIELGTYQKPKPLKNQILVKIHASTVNDWDWSLVRGKPILYRLLYGIRKPKIPIPGIEYAGVIEAVGEDVTDFRIGQRVFGDTSSEKWGTMAEYICLSPEAVQLIPDQIDDITAAALPHASLLAYQSLITIGELNRGMKILINGGGGGMGTFAVQLAKFYDCHITGVDHSDKLQMMKSAGYHKVLDYTSQDFTKSGEKYDIILDAKTTRTPSAYLRCLNAKGKYITVGGSPFQLIRLLFSKILYRHKINILGLKPNQGLEEIVKYVLEDKIKPVIDGPYKIEQAPQLILYFGAGKHEGKIVMKHLA